VKVAVVGATGLIGSRLVNALKQRGDEVIAVSRSAKGSNSKLNTETVQWDPAAEEFPIQKLDDCQAIVNLSGESVAQRWNSSVKDQIHSSRVNTVEKIVAGLAKLPDSSSKVLITASAIGYYGPRGTEPLDESSTTGTDFLATVCQELETQADKATEHGVRTVKLRVGVVLDRTGGALKRMLPPFKLGIGGPIGNGKHYMSWVYIDDVVGIITTALSDSQWQGAVNATSPNPVTNREFSKTLGSVLHRPTVLPTPPFALRVMFGEMSQILVTGQRVLPKKAESLGYSFSHPNLREALEAALA